LLGVVRLPPRQEGVAKQPVAMQTSGPKDEVHIEGGCQMG
jgi:hypothetical protein